MIHDLPLNSPVLGFCKRNVDQLKSWKGPYKLLNIQNEISTIKLSSDPTQFCLISVKLYYNFVIETDKNFDKNTKDTSLKICDNLEHQEVLPTHFYHNILPTSVSSTHLISLIPALTFLLTLSIPVKRGCGKPRKYPI